MKSPIDRLLECPTESLTLREASFIMGPSLTTIARLVNKGVIGSNRCGGRGEGRKLITMIPRASMIRQLVRMSHGDARENLMIEIAEKCPDLMTFAKMEAEKLAAGAEPVKAAPSLGSTRSRSRALPLPRRTRPDANQMSFF